MQKTGLELAKKFFPGTGRSYDRVVRLTSLGLDGRWKRRVVGRVPPSESILELASGTGILTVMLLDRFPKARIACADLTPDYQAIAREKLAARGAGEVEFLLGDAQEIDLKGPYDAVVSCYIPKYCDPARLVGNIDRSLAPGGTVVLHDFSYPRGLVPRLVWRAWFRILDFAAPKVWPEWASTFDRDLSDLVRRSRWRQEYAGALDRLGYQDIRVDHLTCRFAVILSARKPGPPGS